EYDIEDDVVTPSEVGFEVSKTFSEILLDEFQDSNIIQDIIFRAVSKNEQNIVMVGDVKQSIYGFRLADPSIFIKKYKSFRKFEEAKKDEPKCVLLSQNFRSRNEILDTANKLFSYTMSEKLGGIDYTNEHFLIPREDIPELSGMQTEFCLIDTVRGEVRGEAEARFTANKIKSLVESGFAVSDKNGKPRKCRYGDFAILLRSTATNAPIYEREFARLGIPFISPKPSKLLEKSEVQAIVSLLSVIDNPTSDIPLLAALKSPMFAFSADDLCEIRREGHGCLIKCMEKLSKKETPAAKKCEDFLSLLKTLRSLARTESASLLIWEIYNRTSALGMFGALPCGDERQKNLLEFYRAAEDFEALGYTGLYRFISHITALSENGGDIAAARTYSDDAVTIMTMHKSKGLEFPIVFVGSVIKSFNIDDIKPPVLIHSELGIGLNFRDDVTKTECSTLMREAIKRKILDEQKSEEMRLLYVALTRAREKMFITATVENAAKRLSDISLQNSLPELDRINLARRNDALLWFLLPLLRSSSGHDLFAYADVNVGCGPEFPHLLAYALSSEEIMSEVKASKKTETYAAAECEFEVPDFEYGHKLATATPSKLTATGLGTLKQSERHTPRRHFRRPEFLREKALTPAERGTALHMAMQFADFEKCRTESGAKDEILRLVEKKFLTPAQAESISPSYITAFVSSKIGKELLSADALSREFKFSVLLPADELLGESGLSGEKILLQGVMDMFFEKDGEVTIVDFKTDRNRPSGEVLEKYTAQLHAYRRALFEMTGKQASHLILYLVPHNDYIEV
ncbi:MAG: UvrD-helicase domain-containing protein, partial [Oscillospiraceae bacterium]|nr:UvrD-helicase domain-containing protein [Oscillospiraceae bacterium]